jgi:hypothetical protein
VNWRVLMGLWWGQMQAGAKIGGTASGWSLLHLAVALQKSAAVTFLAEKMESVNGEPRLFHRFRDPSGGRNTMARKELSCLPIQIGIRNAGRWGDYRSSLIRRCDHA